MKALSYPIDMTSPWAPCGVDGTNGNMALSTKNSARLRLHSTVEEALARWRGCRIVGMLFAFHWRIYHESDLRVQKKVAFGKRSSLSIGSVKLCVCP